MKALKRILMITTAAFIVCAAFTACADKNSPVHSKDKDASAAGSKSETGEEIGSFTITLYPEYAPITCENFESLVSDGFYDGLTFHRVVDDFMAQGGDPSGDGTGGSDKTIKGEFAANGVENPLSHKRGVVSMARANDPDSASSQFFICYTDDCTFLDGSYAAFGEVTEGMEIVDKFLDVERVLGSDKAMSSPTKPITITKAEMIDDNADGNPRAKLTIAIG